MLVVLIALAIGAPASAQGATFGQVGSQLLAWHLQPPPLFPSQLPTSHRGVNVTLVRWSGLDYRVGFGEPDNADCHTLPNPSDWCVELERTDASVDSWLHQPGDPAMYVRRMRIGSRNVWFFEAGGNAGGWWMVWAEQGRTYGAWAWTDERTALRWITPVVESLRPLTAPTPLYVALGDSYSSGEGAIDAGGNAAFVAGTDTKQDRCHRSGHAYPFLVDSRLTSGTHLVFRACSGALLADLVAKLPGDGGWDEGPQLDAIAPAGGHNDDVRLVTVSVGGNDAGFPAVLEHCIHGFFHSVSDSKCIQFAEGQITRATDLLTHGGTIVVNTDDGTWQFCSAKTRCRSGDPKVVTVPSLTGLYAEIHKRAPHAKIRVLLYPHLFGAAPTGDCTVGTSPTLNPHRYTITSTVIRRLNKLADELDDQIIAREVSLAARRKIDIATADTRAPFARHSLCDSSSAWLNGLMWQGWNITQTSPFSFHPTADGQAAFATVIHG